MSLFDALDTRPLTGRLSRTEAKRYLRERGRTPVAGPVAAAWLTAAIGGVLLGFTLMVLNPPGSDTLLVIGTLLAVISAVLIVFVAVMLSPGDVVRIARLTQFAEANGMRYDERPGFSARAASSPGMVFDQRFSSRTTSDVVSATLPRYIEFGTHEYEETGSERLHRWGYIAVQLDAPLPHIVLDATSNDRLGRSNLPLAFPEARQLRLEGEFHKAFRLLCPPEYGRDAYILFTPDVMVRFIDTAARVDVEIIDDWLFFYIDGRRKTPTDLAEWEWMLSLVAAMLDKIERWARWRDDRLAPTSDARDPAVPVLRPPRGVARGGRRLRGRSRISIWAILGGVLVGGTGLLYLLAWIGETFG